MSTLSVSEAARRLSETHDVIVAPPTISNLFYKRLLDDTKCPVISGRRLIPADYMPAIEQALREQGVLPSQPASAE